MEPAGWILLIVSWVALSALVFYCLRRTLRGEDVTGRTPANDEDRPA